MIQYSGTTHDHKLCTLLLIALLVCYCRQRRRDKPTLVQRNFVERRSKLVVNVCRYCVRVFRSHMSTFVVPWACLVPGVRLTFVRSPPPMCGGSLSICVFITLHLPVSILASHCFAVLFQQVVVETRSQQSFGHPSQDNLVAHIRALRHVLAGRMCWYIAFALSYFAECPE